MVLELAKAFNPMLLTKTSLMLGLGETKEEVGLRGEIERRLCRA